MKRKTYLVILLNVLAFAFFAVAVSADPKSSHDSGSTQPAEHGTGKAPLAPVGSGFTYHGRLTDTGSPANGSYDLQFTLYDAASAGNQIGGPLTVLNQTVTEGLFTVQLDFGQNAFQGSARWLEIAVRQAGGGSYTTLSPRQPLTAAPYALSMMPGGTITGTLSTAPVLSVTNTSNATFANALFGNAPGSSGIGVKGNGGYAGLYGASTSNGVYGTASSVTGIGVAGSASGALASGVIGTGGEYGVVGSGTAAGVSGNSYDPNGYGVQGTAVNGGSTNAGVYGLSYATNGVGVKGEADTSGTGVYGTGGSYGVYGSGGLYGLYGNSTNSGGTGVYGSGTGYGLYGNGGTYGAYGYGASYGLYGYSYSSGTGVYGSGSTGVYGSGGAFGGTGVYGYAGGYGLYGQGNYGVYGSGGYAGVYGTGNSYGLYGYASTGYGTGVYGNDPYNVGVYGQGPYGVYGQGSPYAGYFYGNVHITGSCCSAEQGTYQIDDPTDPANKYINQAAVESTDMLDIVSGNVLLDDKGEATVSVPAWFEAANRDFRYEFAPIGAPAPNMYVAQELKNDRFKLAGGKPGIKVSWQITGVRNDPYAKDHPITPSQDKPSGEKGTYLYPKGYGQPDSKSVGYEQRQKLEQQAQQAKQPQPSPNTPGR